jgi:hypothetical protein
VLQQKEMLGLLTGFTAEPRCVIKPLGVHKQPRQAAKRNDRIAAVKSGCDFKGPAEL